MSKYYKLMDKMVVKGHNLRHSVKETKKLTEKYATTAEQRRLLAFGAILPLQNYEAATVLQLKNSKFDIEVMLDSYWGIKGREDAVPVIELLMSATNHTPFADDIYQTLVKTGKLNPLTLEDLQDITGLENAFQASAERCYDLSQLPEDLTEEEQHTFYWTVASELAARANEGLKAYAVAKDILLDLGCTEAELEAVNSTAAWDLGRAGSIARFCVKLGYIAEDEAWKVMQIAADNATSIYKNWREWLAGYVIGRALGYGNDSKGEYGTFYFFLKQELSPYQEIPFLPGT